MRQEVVVRFLEFYNHTGISCVKPCKGIQAYLFHLHLKDIDL